jgi:hypothetical protein
MPIFLAATSCIRENASFPYFFSFFNSVSDYSVSYDKIIRICEIQKATSACDAVNFELIFMHYFCTFCLQEEPEHPEFFFKSYHLPVSFTVCEHLLVKRTVAQCCFLCSKLFEFL